MLEFLFVSLFVATLVIAPIAWLRMLMAKTQRAYLVNLSLFVLPMLAVFGLGHLTGAIDFSMTTPREMPTDFEPPDLSWFQVVLLSAAGCVWVIGGNALMYRHCKRMGRSFWSVRNLLKPQFRDFSGYEWASLGALAVTSLVLAAVAMNLAPR
jgi:hypothetical protein